jgi:hypothetical protein
MAASARVRQILSEVRELNDDERAELEVELFAEDAATGRTRLAALLDTRK